MTTAASTALAPCYQVDLAGVRPCLRALHRPEFLPLELAWDGPELRRRIAGGRKQLLARAVGLQRRREAGSGPLRIIDATGGLGRDAFTLAALGAEVILLERCAPLFALLCAEHARLLDASDAGLRGAAERLQLHQADAIDWLPQADPAEVVHLDPMYDDHGRRALPQKGMQMLRELAGDDADAGSLLAAALASRTPRVVVKRAARAAALAGLTPAGRIDGSQARYDLYLRSTAGTVNAAVTGKTPTESQR